MKITCTKKQALIIEIALETLSRLTAGQLDEVKRSIEFMQDKFIEVDRNDFNKVIAELKLLLFPNLQQNAYYGVGQKELGNAQIAYEMYKIFQNVRSKSHKKDCYCVMHDMPLHYSNEPLIKIEE